MYYTIAAIPTEYRGRQYRSRLEAKWAAFFDLLGWEVEYEPYDLGRWSPDFLVRAPVEDAKPLLVEVKPITTCDLETLERMVAACQERGMWEMLTSPLAGVLLVGVAPFSPAAPGCPVQIGWMPTPRTRLRGSGAYLVWLPLPHTLALWDRACNAVQWQGARQ